MYTLYNRVTLVSDDPSDLQGRGNAYAHFSDSLIWLKALQSATYNIDQCIVWPQGGSWVSPYRLFLLYVVIVWINISNMGHSRFHLQYRISHKLSMKVWFRLCGISIDAQRRSGKTTASTSRACLLMFIFQKRLHSLMAIKNELEWNYFLRKRLSYRTSEQHLSENI